jgi:hypothetical protein
MSTLDGAEGDGPNREDLCHHAKDLIFGGPTIATSDTQQPKNKE